MSLTPEQETLLLRALAELDASIERQANELTGMRRHLEEVRMLLEGDP